MKIRERIARWIYPEIFDKNYQDHENFWKTLNYCESLKFEIEAQKSYIKVLEDRK